MKLVGRQYLNKNNYDKLIIDQCKDEVEVKFTSTDKLSRIESKDYFTDLLVGLSDEEKVIKIVKHFLRNSNINEIINKTYLPRYEGWFSVIKGMNNRLLALKLLDNDLSKKITKLIFDKYKADRYKYYLENEVKYIGSSSYKRSYGNYSILNTREEKLIENEKEFLKYLIESKLNYVNEACIRRLEYYSDILDHIDFGDYLICGDLKIGIGSNLIYKELFKIIDEYNYELKKNKEENYQLKLKI